ARGGRVGGGRIGDASGGRRGRARLRVGRGRGRRRDRTNWDVVVLALAGEDVQQTLYKAQHRRGRFAGWVRQATLQRHASPGGANGSAVRGRPASRELPCFGTSVLSRASSSLAPAAAGASRAPGPP